MNEQASVAIDTEQPANRHWFRGNFYRKEGAKEVLNLRKFSYASAGTFALLVTLSFFRELPQALPDEKSDISEPAQTSPAYSFPELVDIHASPSTYTHITKSDRAMPRTSGPQLITRPKVALPPATMVRARIIEAVTDGPVRARIAQAVQVRGETALSEGSILVGTGSSSENRLLIRFDQLVHKDGSIQSIQAQAIDPDDKLAGVKGSDLSGTALKISGSLGLTFLGALTETLQDKEAAAGVAHSKPNLKNAFLNGVSRTALEQSQRELSELKDSSPRIKVDGAKEIFVIFE